MDSSLPKRARKSHLGVNEKEIVLNVYNHLSQTSFVKKVEECATITGVSRATIYRILKEYQDNECCSSVKPRTGRPTVGLDEDMKYAIRRKVHAFYIKNEVPTLNKVLEEIRKDEDLPKFGRTTLWKVLRQLNFRFLKRNRNSILLDRNDIIAWRRDYLTKIKEYRATAKQIYYLDETWLNEDHTVGKVWQDQNITSKKQAFMDGWSTGLRNPPSKGRRLIITHIGSSQGFVDDALLLFESKTTGDYHEEINAAVFEKWFSTKVLSSVAPGSVIVMDNAPYHSRKLERIPTTAWRKDDITNWLTSHNISYDSHMVKAQLIQIVKTHKRAFNKYVVDEMARDTGITVTRLPPYHCELNPIELVWAQIKTSVARENKTFKMEDTKQLFYSAVSKVDSLTWQNCIKHVISIEKKMWDMDDIIGQIVDVQPLIITSDGDDSEDELFSSDEDSDN